MRARAAAKLNPRDFRVLGDDDAITVEYGPGSVRIIDPMLYPDILKRIADAGGRRLQDGPAMTERKPAKWYDAGELRELTRAELERYALPPKHDPARRASCEKVIGQVRAGYRLLQTNGHAAVLERTTEPGEELHIGASPDHPVRAELTPAFWRAYSRVRTCRNERSDAVRLTFSDAGLELEASDADAGIMARELVPAGDITIGELGELGAEPYRVVLSDLYLWPLRGAALTFRQESRLGPVWFAGLEPLAIVVMPMRD